MNEIERMLPGCRVSHDSPESFVLNWKNFLAGARFQGKHNQWKLSIQEIINGEIDNGYTKVEIVDKREQALSRVCEILCELNETV